MREQIIKVLANAAGLSEAEIHLEVTDNPDFGDYSSNVAMTTFENYKLQIINYKFKTPREYAEDLVSRLAKDKRLKNVIDKIEVAGPGFINFWLKKDILLDILRDISSYKDEFGYSSSKKGKRIVVEYTDPNPFKEFHIGHLISNVTGESFARLQEACGATVWRADYFGDVGTHVAKSIWGLQKKMAGEGIALEDLAKQNLKERVNYMGQGYAIGARVYEEDEEAKEEIGRLNTVLYMVAQEMWKREGKNPVINYDPEGKIDPDEIKSLYELYVVGRKWSLDYFETIYERLGTRFDGYYPESKVSEVGYKYVLDNVGKVFEKSEGAVIFRGEKFGLHTRVFINKHNLPTYEAKELGLAPTKYKDFPYDQSVIVVGKEIKEYFEVLVEALKQVNPRLGNVTKPICTGMVNLPSGKMSSRSGNVVTVTGLLDRLKEMVKERMTEQDYSEIEKEEISEQVAVGALKYAFLKNSVGSDFIFDMETSLSLEGNSGPYLQYTYARTRSVLRKLKPQNSNLKIDSKQTEQGSDKNLAVSFGDFNGKIELNRQELSVLRELVHFPETVDSAAKTYSPNLICSYLYGLAQKYNNFYNNNRILEDNIAQSTKHIAHRKGYKEQSEFRLALTAATGQVIKNGLYLLGIKAPERM